MIVVLEDQQIALLTASVSFPLMYQISTEKSHVSSWLEKQDADDSLFTEQKCEGHWLPFDLRISSSKYRPFFLETLKEYYSHPNIDPLALGLLI